MHDNLSRMAIFAAVVEANSFSEAARRLSLSKSAVSKQIAQLETQLGVRLLNRSTRRIGLTEAGQLYYESCARVVAEAEQVERTLGNLQATPLGTLKVNGPIAFGNSHLVPALLEFLAAHPELHAEVTLQDDYINLLEAGVDLAIRIGRLADSSLVARKLAPVRLVVCASPEYLARRGEPTTPEALADHEWLVYTVANPPDRCDLVRGGERHAVRVSGRIRTNSGDVILAAARAGVGIGMMPAFMVAADIRAGRLRELLAGYDGPQTALYAVYPHSRHVTAKVRLFVDFLAERFAGGSAWECGGAGEVSERRAE
jgi:DNA-binding transcriptional LysR family regulator